MPGEEIEAIRVRFSGRHDRRCRSKLGPHGREPHGAPGETRPGDRSPASHVGGDETAAEKGPTEEIKKYAAERIGVLEQELTRMESEYHELNVQQIRDELRGG